MARDSAEDFSDDFDPPPRSPYDEIADNTAASAEHARAVAETLEAQGARWQWHFEQLEAQLERSSTSARRIAELLEHVRFFLALILIVMVWRIWA